MARYLVAWEIDYEGEGDPEAAARWAWDKDGNETKIDLAELDEARLESSISSVGDVLRRLTEEARDSLQSRSLTRRSPTRKSLSQESGWPVSDPSKLIVPIQRFMATDREFARRRPYHWHLGVLSVWILGIHLRRFSNSMAASVARMNQLPRSHFSRMRTFRDEG
ncbi:DUF2274 domain-containing protein [Mesorhizobium sp. M1A.F.Ca.IN.022.07.1.1]|uniref:DUF2274 domain-containing protein n=1 Tax=Mesorhizobium sp. M1A.F.Ca.IN.022.07.1.1 TaxID=2496767 RepID=UPI000FCA94F1|nr:DUF2274 domain-containing protein [Mesorhizobium sp. M1A.F.Ca.IN.022.07.1.1]RUV98199.1 DUF2274 domain-containing protein [Mesorhizobium sp. M1A.F.Ca.IN.022.07.1.1]